MENTYKHTQFGTLIFCGFLIFGISSVALMSITDSLENRNIWALTGIIAIIFFFFTSLTVEIKDQSLKFWFSFGLIQRRYEISQIKEAKVVQNPWYYGWGIHWTPNGWLYNVSGSQAVEITLENNKKVRVGSDEAESLKEAIEQSRTAQT